MEPANELDFFNSLSTHFAESLPDLSDPVIALATDPSHSLPVTKGNDPGLSGHVIDNDLDQVLKFIEDPTFDINSLLSV